MGVSLHALAKSEVHQRHLPLTPVVDTRNESFKATAGFCRDTRPVGTGFFGISIQIIGFTLISHFTVVQQFVT
jgi:hypothetical protein